MRIPLIMQIQSSDNGAAALAMMLGYYKRYVSLQEIRKYCVSSRNGSSPKQICAAAMHYGLDADIVDIGSDELLTQKKPVLICWRKKYYTIFLKAGKNTVTLMDPVKGKHTIKKDKFLQNYQGRAIILTPGADFKKGGRYVNTISMLSQRLYGYKRWLVLLSIFSAASVFLNIISLTYRQRMVDDVLSGKDRSLLIFLASAMALITVLKIVINISDTVVSSKVSRRMAASSGSDIYKRLVRMPLSFFEKIGNGEIMDRLERNKTIDNSLLTTLAPKFFNGVSLCFYIFLCYHYNALLSTVLLGVYLLIYILMIILQRNMLIAKRSVISTGESVRSSMMSAINSIDSIKASGSEDKFFRIWNDRVNEESVAERKTLGLDALYSMVQTLQNVSSSAIMLILGAYLIIRGELTLGMFSSLQGVFSNVSTNLNNMFSTSRQIQNMRTGLERVNDFKSYDITPEISLDGIESPNKLVANIRADHITYCYNKGDAPVLNDVSITISPGEMVALVGASGCGKSTLMKLIAGMYQTQEGSVTYDGKSRQEIPDVVFYSSVACVDQDINLFADTVRNNLKMWDDHVQDFEMILAAKDARIHDRIIKNNQGYDTMISSNGRNYSGGEHQRLELARALSAEPTLLILDEFTSALDAKTEEKIFDAIRNKGTTCLIAAHRLSTVVECDKIYVMDHGRIVEQGTHSELYKAKGLYHKLVSLH